MGAAFSRQRFGIAEPRVALLSIGEEPGKGTSLVKETHALLESGAAGASVRFVGNVEGRDVMSDAADVIVTDGFTGNVVLKTLEGSMRFAFQAVLKALSYTEETKAASGVLLPVLLPLAQELDPDTYGGAMLLGVEGVCIISHGSSSAKAIHNAVQVAHDAVSEGLVNQVRAAVTSGGEPPAPASAGAGGESTNGVSARTLRPPTAIPG
jgi:glycerol-3-phosphate acyltransferase PlsX